MELPPKNSIRLPRCALLWSSCGRNWASSSANPVKANTDRLQILARKRPQSAADSRGLFVMRVETIASLTAPACTRYARKTRRPAIKNGGSRR
jgi:hypothetical protein